MRFGMIGAGLLLAAACGDDTCPDGSDAKIGMKCQWQGGAGVGQTMTSTSRAGSGSTAGYRGGVLPDLGGSGGAGGVGGSAIGRVVATARAGSGGMPTAVGGMSATEPAGGQTAAPSGGASGYRGGVLPELGGSGGADPVTPPPKQPDPMPTEPPVTTPPPTVPEKPVEMCGNGKVETGEVCDGNCPTPAECDDKNPCTVDYVDGADCSRKCAHEPFKENYGGSAGCVCDGRGGCKTSGGTSPGQSGSANSAWYGLCKSDADCGGWTCVSNLCTADCASDANCSASSAGAKATCLSGSQLCLLTCSGDASCPAGQFCQDLGDVQVCNPRPCGHAGAPECPSGFTCQSNVCQK